jgi:hypothetical protein
MPAIASEKALRKLVIDLAATTPEDIVAVLAMLDPRTRAAVQGLLAAYTDLSDVFDLAMTPAATNTSGLSDWLALRTQGAGATDDDFRMTPKAAETLRTIVASMPRHRIGRAPNDGADR